ncbi:MAG: hypothetical protein E6K60_10920 [Nitrospirae bacterium]|nr:MAG: hypothetical protein E6K60_10920 [Nitrospirota bacterium]
MLKFLGFIIMLSVAFVSGVYVGTTGPDAIVKKAKDIGAEVAAKTSLMQRDQTFRSRLLTVKDRMVQAKSDLLDKNYGKAAAELSESADMLARAKDTAAEQLRPKLESLAKKITEMAAEAKAMKPGVVAKCNDAMKEVDGLLNH